MKNATKNNRNFEIMGSGGQRLTKIMMQIDNIGNKLSPGHWPSGVLDPLRARRRPRRVGFCDHCSYQIENSYNVFLLRIYNLRIFLP